VTPLGDYSMESLVEKWSITTEDAYRHVTKHTPLQARDSRGGRFVLPVPGLR